MQDNTKLIEAIDASLASLTAAVEQHDMQIKQLTWRDAITEDRLIEMIEAAVVEVLSRRTKH